MPAPVADLSESANGIVSKSRRPSHPVGCDRSINQLARKKESRRILGCAMLARDAHRLCCLVAAVLGHRPERVQCLAALTATIRVAGWVMAAGAQPRAAKPMRPWS